jgi:excisionase family DNA binding protein
MMTVKELAVILNVSPKLAYRMLGAGKIGHYRIGEGRGRIRISQEDVARFLLAAHNEEKEGRREASPPSVKRSPKLSFLKLR